MRTKRTIFSLLLVALLFLGTGRAIAQVTIGAETAPQPYSLLELNTSEIKGGLRLPRLTTAERITLTSKLDANAAGLTIYNTTTNCTDTWNGTTWISNCNSNAAPIITIQPRAFNWKETTGAGNLTGIGGNATTISVTASGVGTLTYQWYEVPANVNAQPTAVSGATARTYTPVLTALGMRRYFCRVTDSNNISTDSEIAEVAVGCGAKTVQGGWHTFMCYNLGATIADKSIAAQKAYNSPVYSYAGTTATAAERNAVVYGDLYQWGRITDDHEKRTSGTTATLATNDNATAPAGISNLFIKAPSYPYNWTGSATRDLLWRNHKNTYDPCPAGWRVPSQYEWANIFNGNSVAASSSATANTWIWYDGNTKGYEIKPDGQTTTLFLPAAGYRYFSTGELSSVGSAGHYWSATISSTYSLGLAFDGTSVSPADIRNRAYGFSVRCMSVF